MICDGAALHIAKLERLIDTMEKLIPPQGRVIPREPLDLSEALQSSENRGE